MAMNPRKPWHSNRLHRIVLLTLCLSLSLPGKSRAEEAANTIHFELLGNGILYSINYDRLFTHNFSGRVGLMYFSGEATSTNAADPKVSVKVSLIPVTASYLVGQGNHRLELGAGPVLAYVSADVSDGVEGVSASGLASLTGIVGYRYQPVDGGFNFRIGFTPHVVFKASPPVLPWFGLSLGYTF